MLAKIARELDGPKGGELLPPGEPTRWRWIRLIKALGYEPHMFETAATLLARFLAAEPQDYDQNSAREAFAELFRLYMSGTQAKPEQRRAFVRRLATSGDPNMRRCASISLDALLTVHNFISTSKFDFGARSRGWGWQPKLNRDVEEWHSAAIDLAVELSLVLDDARDTLADSVRYLWFFDACHDALERAVTAFVRVKPWIKGWIAFRVSLRYDGKTMPDPMRKRLEAIIQRLKPSDLLHRARAAVLDSASPGWDVADGEPDEGGMMTPYHNASQIARDIGSLLAHNAETRKEFLTELMTEPRAPRAYDFGRGLAEGTNNLDDMWRDLTGHFSAATAPHRNVPVLGGFLCGAHQRDTSVALAMLEATIGNPVLASTLPYLQARVGIDEDGIARLRRAIEKGVVKAEDFLNIANGAVGNSPPIALRALLLDIADLSDGVEIALDILHMHFHRDREAGRPRNPALIELGRKLLRRADFSKKGVLRDFGLHTIIRLCCAGLEGEATAREVCMNIRNEMEGSYLSHHDLSHVLMALFETQPSATLDMFLLPEPAPQNHRMFTTDFGFCTPVEDMDPAVLRQWADREPTARYPLLGHVISMFVRRLDDEDNGISPLFLEMLDYAPDKRVFLGGFWERLQPRSWSGSLADILTRRKAQMLTLRDSAHADVRQWIDEIEPELEQWIDHERNRNREDEKSFE